MRPVLTVLAANLCAFALGVVVTLWLTTLPPTAMHRTATRPAALTQPLAAGRDEPSTAPNRPDATPAPQQQASAPLATASSPASAGSQPHPSSAAAMPDPPADDKASPTQAPSAAAVKQAPAAAGAPPPPTPPQPTPGTVAAKPSTVARPGVYVLQFAAFQQPPNALKVQAQLAKYGYAAKVVPTTVGDKAWQLVQINGFADRETATATATAVQHDTGLTALVMRSPAR